MLVLTIQRERISINFTRFLVTFLNKMKQHHRRAEFLELQDNLRRQVKTCREKIQTEKNIELHNVTTAELLVSNFLSLFLILGISSGRYDIKKQKLQQVHQNHVRSNT